MKRSKAITLLTAIILGTGLIATQAAEKKAAPKKQTTCPVKGGKVNATSSHVDVNGKRIYVCCPGCIAKIKADPEKYIKQLEAQGITLDQPQSVCPVMGGKIKANSPHVDVNGKRVYLCCPGCVGKLKADPDKYIKKLEDAGVVLEKAPATSEKAASQHKHSEHPHSH